MLEEGLDGSGLTIVGGNWKDGVSDGKGEVVELRPKK